MLLNPPSGGLTLGSVLKTLGWGVNTPYGGVNNPLDTSFYLKACMSMNRLGMDHECDGRTDGQTDRQNGL